MRAYLFDLDGTLTDARAGLCASFRAGLAAIGCPDQPDTALAAFLGAPLPIVFRAVRPEVTAAETQRGIEAFRLAYEREGIYGNTLYPGIRRMLQAVRSAGHRSWIVTSKPEVYARKVVGLLDIAPLIDGVVGAGLDELDTKTQLVARAIAAAGMPPARALMLGDRNYDVVGALSNQVAVVGALWGYGSKEELAAAGCQAFSLTPDAFRSQYVEGADAESVFRMVSAG